MQVDAPHFCCGFIAENGVIVQAAPIIRYMEGRSVAWAEAYVSRKGWLWKTA